MDKIRIGVALLLVGGGFTLGGIFGAVIGGLIFAAGLKLFS